MSVITESTVKGTHSLADQYISSKGSGRKLTDNQKVDIVIQKQLRPTPTSTNQNIAKDYGVSTNLVSKTSIESLNPEQQALYQKRARELGINALALTQNAIDKAEQLVALADKPSHLGGVVAAMGKANEIYRLETGQSTSNVNVNIIEHLNREIVNQIKLAKAYPDEYEMPDRQGVKEQANQYLGQEYDESELTCLALLDDENT